VRASGGAELALAARAFVLAGGGIENARLLLLSRGGAPDGLGNQRDQVGRWLMNHPKNYAGVLRLARPVREAPYFFGCLWRGFAGYAGLRLADEEQRERGLLNAYVRFEPLFPWSDSPGVEALVTMAKRSRGLLGAWKARRAGEVVELRDWSETGDDSEMQSARKSALASLALPAKVALHLPSVTRYAAARLFARGAPAVRRVRVRNFMEMQPDRDNRVTLGAARDAYGQPVAHVRHRPTALDKRSLAAVHAALSAEVEEQGLGTLAGALTGAEEPWPVDQDASHHMGTTRMGTDPATSVVDPRQRVHGVRNVWISGASVFPTSGCANPTFTIVALAIRLAESVRDALDRGDA
jgi:choline dehydrogenase-like flavoprotein